MEFHTLTKPLLSSSIPHSAIQAVSGSTPANAILKSISSSKIRAISKWIGDNHSSIYRWIGVRDHDSYVPEPYVARE